ncbi:MAG: hypothetical protein PHP95_11910 [Desulfuromonadaceae bacterium]|nr:hypothetical protein [Desulfuromonadaceae bacterium]MDD2849151.1 hypothetical protein [Desulfuromonadaceae bacterium]MDD4129519.1 hypothetical protein [Desulfuromonadaceae bacterium]
MHKQERNIIANLIKQINRGVGVRYGHRAVLADFDAFASLGRSCQKEARQQVNNYLRNELFLTRLAIESFASLTLAIGSRNKKDLHFLPLNFISETGLPVPDVILQSFLVQICNYTDSVISLVEKGVDNPARALLRTTNELLWQSLILLANKELLSGYVKAETQEDSTRIWYQLFGKGKLTKQLHELEKTLGLSERDCDEMKTWRSSSQEFYSQAIHHSFIAVTVGAFPRSFEDSEYCNTALLGHASMNSRSTLIHLNYQLYFFFLFFDMIFKRIYKLEFPLEDEFWYHWFVCKECFICLFQTSKRAT